MGDLKQVVWSLTNVVPHRQKILGLIKGKQLPDDNVAIVELGLVIGAKVKEFMMVRRPKIVRPRETQWLQSLL